MTLPGRIFSLSGVLGAIWLVLSGHYTRMVISFGIASVVLVVWLASRMRLIDEEGQTVQLGWRILPYYLYLLSEIGKANIDVIRRILTPGLPISPTVVELRTTQKSDLGRVLYANSITLTPGTVSLDVWQNGIRVHALSQEGARALAAGDMDRRVTAAEEKAT
jgi:multicomponent Na+:H+ antiporter subunit E